MNVNVKMILSFITGAAAGAGIGIFATKRYLEEKANEKINKEVEEGVKDYQEKFDKEMAKLRLFAKTQLNSVYGIPKEDPDQNPRAPKEEVKAALKKNWEGTTNYAKMYRPKSEREPGFSEEDYKEEAEDENTDDNADSEYPKEEEGISFYRPPKIISISALGNLPEGTETVGLTYYALSEIVVEDTEVLEDPERFLGDCLDKFGFRENDEETIYVYNAELSTVFEVSKSYDIWDGDTP